MRENPVAWRHGQGHRVRAGTYRQGGELVAGQVEGLQLGPLVDAEGQLCDLVAAEVEAPQAAQGVEALGDATEVVAGQVHVWGEDDGVKPPAGRTPGPRELHTPTCQVDQALQASGQVALRALGVPEVEGLQGRHRRELPADHGEPRGRDSVRAGAGTRPNPGIVGSSLENGDSPELRVQEGVVVEDQGLEVDQASHLRREALQLVVAQVEVEQVRQVDEELVGDGLDAAGTRGPSGLPATCTSPGSPSQTGREQDPE